MRSLLLIAVTFCLFNRNANAVAEKQMISGMKDKEFISGLPLSRFSKDERFLNILILAQDDRNGHIPGWHTSPDTIRNSRLGSRSDIIMLLSLDKVSKTGRMYSIYRDEFAPENCEINQEKQDQLSTRKLAEVYGQLGRKAFLYCVNEMLTERMKATGQGPGLILLVV